MRVPQKAGRPHDPGRLSPEVRKARMAVGIEMHARRQAARVEQAKLAFAIARKTGIPVCEVIDALAENRAAEDLLGLVERTWHRTLVGRSLDVWMRSDPHGARLG